jgi:dTDP-4-amino-4,6-dideoxygalactose transaminase
MQVPFLDLKAQYESIAGEINSAVRKVLESAAFAGGPFVERFEEEFAQFCNCRHAIGVGNGTDAIWFSLLALGIGPGDEVITVPNTFIATAEAISFCGARPVFVDVGERSFTMDPALLEAAITPLTRAVIPVHLFGQTAEMDPILEIARQHGLFVIEDACQAHGARYRGKPAGSMGDAGCFSFYPGKNLGAYGEAGAVVTNNTDLAATLKMLRDHGQSRKYHHGLIGWNGRMDGIQGAILSVKLRYLPSANEARRKNAALYSELLGDMAGIGLPVEMEYASHVYHLYVIRARERGRLMKALAGEGIGCGIHYPVPIHLQEAYRFLGHGQGSFPVAETCAGEIVSLPMFPELSDAQICYVADAFRSFCEKPF